LNVSCKEACVAFIPSSPEIWPAVPALHVLVTPCSRQKLARNGPTYNCIVFKLLSAFQSPTPNRSSSERNS